ncbi:MAG TPA: hypothetical protein VFX41_02065 [Actinomycetales bacterium]|jgi:hypothetical protein|nr:hypothetical protein [Actinomycetales bacterium]
MTQPQVHPTATPASAEPATLPVRPGLLRVLRDQRKVVGAAAIVAAACFWVMVPLGEWRTAALTAGGVLLALLNHLASELWLARLIGSGAEPSRGRIAASAITRLAVLSVVAVGVAVLFWPDGIGLLLGLAIFRLIALVMTGIPLLKELKGR